MERRTTLISRQISPSTMLIYLSAGNNVLVNVFRTADWVRQLMEPVLTCYVKWAERVSITALETIEKYIDLKEEIRATTTLSQVELMLLFQTTTHKPLHVASWMSEKPKRS